MFTLSNFTEKEIEEFHNWHKKLKSKKGIKNQYSNGDETERMIWFSENPCPISSKIESFYNSGYGYKFIAKKLNISYMVARNLFKNYFGISVRTGCDVVTDKLKEQRSINASGEKSIGLIGQIENLGCRKKQQDQSKVTIKRKLETMFG